MNTKRVAMLCCISGKLQEVDALRKKLSVLIEDHESLLYGEHDILLAKYNRDVGHLEFDRTSCLHGCT